MRFLVAAGLLAGAALAQAPSQIDIASNALKADVSFLASDALEGRGTPSRGLDIAGEFIAAQFRRAGLEPGGTDFYFQTARFETAAVKQADITLSIESAGNTIAIDTAKVVVQAPAAVDLKSAPVIFAADEAALSALTLDQVQGKVLVLGSLRGRPAEMTKLQPALVVAIAAGRAAGRPQLREAGPVIPVLLVNDARLRDASAISAHIPAPEVTPVILRNVIGVLRGSDPQLKDTYLMLTAHYDHLGIRDNNTSDHIYNGADDDASGTASLIEIASALAALPTRPKRSIVFIALFGEELGDLGSHYYASHPIFPLAKTTADVNLEQLGRTDDTEGPHVHMFNLTGYDFTDLPAVFNKAGAQTGIKAVKDEKNSDSYFTRSDNAAFAQAGVPSTTLSVAYNFPDYHQPGDEWQKLDYDNMALVDRTIALAVLDLANSSVTTKWNESNPKTAAFVKARELSLNADKL